MRTAVSNVWGDDKLPPPALMRVIIPVHHSDPGGYHSDGLAILRTALASLDESGAKDFRVSLIDNGSHPEAREAIQEMIDLPFVDRVVVNSINRGKIDAVLSEARATFEPLLVVVDADVAFRKGWQQSATVAMGAFPECGMLGLHPLPSLAFSSSSSIWQSTVLPRFRSRARILRAPLVDPEDLKRFDRSVGRTLPHQEHQLVVCRDDRCLMLGFGHFAFVMRRDVLDDLPRYPSLSVRRGDDAKWLEKPANKAGWWCASLCRAGVHHIGNQLDDEERHTITEFLSYELDDLGQYSSDSTTGDPPFLPRYTPHVGHALAIRLAKRALASRVAGRLIPQVDRTLVEGSAVQLR